ncbi:MAG: glutamate racemase [bacterium]|nr:glutamate racemase [bacterium]
MIGIYDSGIGGLGIFNTIIQVLPQESIFYFGDTKYFPFGDRSMEEIRKITLAGLKKLEKKCSLLVIACNTASVNDLAYYRENIKIPIIAVVPVIKTAAHISQTKKIALLATTSTVSAKYISELIGRFAGNCEIIKVSCSGLADAVEYGDDAKQDELLNKCTIDAKTADVLILGCTHYTLIKGKLQNKFGPDVIILDSNEAVTRHVLRIMRKEKLEDPQTEPKYIFECSGDKKSFLREVEKHTHLPVA